MIGFRRELYDSFIAVNGWLIGLVSLAITTLLAFMPKLGGSTLSTIFLFIICFETIFLITILHTAIKNFNRAQFPLPKIIFSKKATGSKNKFLGLLLLEPSTLFTFDQAVSIFYKEKDLEEFLGTGYVGNIQTDGKIQVFLLEIEFHFQEKLDSFLSNNKTYHEMMIVRPSAHSHLLREGSHD